MAEDMSSNDESTSFQHSNVRKRNAFNEAASMINSGGLGNRSRSTSYSSTSSSSSHSPPPRSSTQLARELTHALDTYEKQYMPSQSKSLAGIALRAFLLGLAFTASLATTLYLLSTSSRLWRAPFFITTLSFFHFLEFYITALANTHDAKVASFLLSSNGPAYTIAHTVAFSECLLTNFFFRTTYLPPTFHRTYLLLGLALLVVGQFCRSLAMYQAGTNFSHLVRHTKAPTHTLVTTGLYSYLRHPSYFGFFWWGIGTQVLCGNVVSLVGYAWVLRLFFAKRVKGEEESLVRFFGDEYVNYRRRTPVGIPFI